MEQLEGRNPRAALDTARRSRIASVALLRGATGPVGMGLGTLFTGAAALAIGMPVHWVLAFCAVAGGIAFLVPPAVRRSVASLDRDLQRHRQRNEIHALLPAYRRARLARALGPRTAMRMRLAESLLDSGEAVRARDLLEKTMARAADGDLPRYLPLLVRARFLAGDDAGTLKAFAALRRHGFPLPGHVHAAARAMLRTGRPPAEAESLAETALAGPTPNESAAAALVRAEIALARGLPDAAMVHLDACDESRLPREARPAATLARGRTLLALGRHQEAVAVLRGVEEIGKGTRFAAEAADAIGTAGSVNGSRSPRPVVSVLVLVLVLDGASLPLTPFAATVTVQDAADTAQAHECGIEHEHEHEHEHEIPMGPERLRVNDRRSAP